MAASSSDADVSSALLEDMISRSAVPVHFLEPLEDVEALPWFELRERVREYYNVILELQTELTKAKLATKDSQRLSNVNKLRIYTDSAGICLDKFSAHCTGDLADDWCDFEHVSIECVDETTGKMSDFDWDFDTGHCFSHVVEEVHEMGLKLFDRVRALTGDKATSEVSVVATEHISDALVQLSSAATIIPSKPMAAASMRAPDYKRRLMSSSARDALEFLEELKRQEEDVKEEEVSEVSAATKAPSLLGCWPGDLPIYTRGKTIRVMRGIRSTDALMAADFYMNLRRRFDSSRPIRVLSLDGGGLRTALSTQLALEIEKGAGGVELCKCFDLIVGTSAGGLFAIELAKLGWTVQQCDDWVDSLGKKHFAKSKRESRLSAAFTLLTHESLTDTKKFRKTIKDTYTHWGVTEDPPMKGRTDGHCAHVAVTSVRSDIVPWRPFVFRSYNFGHEVSAFEGTDVATMSEASFATTAAPVMMKPFEMERERLYAAGVKMLGRDMEYSRAEFLDGGAYQNDPALTAFFEAKQLFGYSREVLLVSIGTGHLPKQYNQHQSVGWMQISKIGTLGMGIFETKEVANLQLLRQLLVEGHNYFRFDLTVEREENDRYALMSYFRKRARAWLRKHDNEKAKLQALGRFLSRYATEPLPEDVAQ